jgi:ssDNA-binding Zn-finger/Zn-ribbon topoisomerase 1
MPRKLTHEQYVQKVYEAWGDEYKVIGHYENNNTKILVKHNVPNCGHEWEIRPNNLSVLKQTCPKCSYKKRADKLYVFSTLCLPHLQ